MELLVGFFIILSSFILLVIGVYIYFKRKLGEYKSYKEAIVETKKALEESQEELDKVNDSVSKAKEQLSSIEEKMNLINDEYDEIYSETEELRTLKSNADSLIKTVSDKEKEKVNLSTTLSDLYEKRDSLEERIYKLQSKIDLYSTLEEFSDSGHFELPDYLYQTSERFAEEIKRVREEQKALIQAKDAIYFPETALGAVIGTQSDSRRALEGQVKLMLLAFNEDCDLLISKVRLGYYPKTLERIKSLADSLEKLSVHFQCRFNIKYIELKLEECTLQYQYKLKKQEEDEEQRLIREQMREEQKARREYEKAIADAEKEEKMYNALLEKAKLELQSASAEKMAAVKAQIELLEQQLAEAQNKEERARSLAEQTRRGYIYVISNIGSFGENIYKIGLTRRLDPMERVRELGDASVPFFFDVHAFIYSEDAPALERELHYRFNDRRVNAVNYRREFFNVKLEDIRQVIIDITGSDVDFHMTALAEEYYETQRIRGTYKSIIE
ncbi:DUF4041 domain-containing protein [Actinobacillus succinogenes]|nr:DUF4041 domain-containing protein [Actinobacillus succinogenes]